MKRYNLFLLVAYLFVCFTVAASKHTDAENIQTAWKKIHKENVSTPAVLNTVKVVYFYGAEQEPLRGWKERLSRTLEDVTRYYAEETARFGVKTKGLLFDKDKKGSIRIVPVKGALPSEKYNSNSGGVIQKEIAEKLGAGINFNTDFVLVINGFSDKSTDGKYFFHAPYHGGGNGHNGICHVADCELLDAALLTDTVHSMTFTEMYASNKNCTVAEFNNWYIGGIAHELGHVLGLPHDFGNPSETTKEYGSLMGEYGSRHYRDYMRGGNPSSRLSAAGVLQMISHPLIAQTDKHKMLTSLNLNVSSFKTVGPENNKAFEINYTSDCQPYGVVLLLREINTSEYLSRSFYTTQTSEKGRVVLFVDSLPAKNYSAVFKFLFTNADPVSVSRTFRADKDGNVLEAEAGEVNPRLLLEQVLSAPSTPVTEKILPILKDIVNPRPLVKPSEYAGDSLFLSDALWERASVGWKIPARNYFTTEYAQTFLLVNKQQLFSKGLYAHAPSVYAFQLGGKWKSFSALIGLRDLAHQQGSARFRVFGDGRELYVSRVLRVDDRDSFQVDVSGVQLLEIKAEGTEGHNFNCWSVWLNPLLKR